MGSGTFYERKICILASLSGIIQGILWTVLSVLAILVYEDVWEPDISSENPGSFLVIFYLKKSITSYRKIDSEEFNYFMYFYAIASSLWLITSCVLFKDAVQRKVHTTTTCVLGFWVTVTLLLSIVDVILMSFLSNDLYEFKRRYTDDFEVDNYDYYENYNIGAGILIGVSIRGVIIFLWNITMAICLISGLCKFVKYQQPVMNKPFINAYDQSTASTLPWPAHTNFNPLAASNWRANQNLGLSNPVFAQNETSPHDQRPTPNSEMRDGYPSNTHENYHTPQNTQQAHSGFHISHDANPVVPSTHWSYVRGQEEARVPQPRLKTAKVGNERRGNVTPLRNVPSPRIPPSIPSPDYTPPSSPRANLRPVLKNRSNYM